MIIESDFKWERERSSKIRKRASPKNAKQLLLSNSDKLKYVRTFESLKREVYSIVKATNSIKRPAYKSEFALILKMLSSVESECDKFMGNLQSGLVTDYTCESLRGTIFAKVDTAQDVLLNIIEDYAPSVGISTIDFEKHPFKLISRDLYLRQVYQLYTRSEALLSKLMGQLGVIIYLIKGKK